MRRTLIESMSCPYCGGALRLTRVLREDTHGVEYGLVECRCFVFPIVEGILLLSLAKGYGGAEEALQPYVPLQAAAVHYLQQGQVAGFEAWMREHVPLAAPFLDRSVGTFLEYSSAMAARLEREVEAYLDDFGRYGVLGTPLGAGQRAWRRAKRAARGVRSGRGHQLGQLVQFYPARFFSPYVHSTMMQLGQLPLSGRVLSLCCGHGMLENLLNADGRAAEVVSMDSQFLNLLVTRRFVRPGGAFVCHDLQFGLPFADGAFDAVFSSTCLPEIPAQRLFACEAIRVTAPAGWTWFDCIWNVETGGARINGRRFYRFAQNFFARLEDYAAFFAECAGGRDVAITVPTTAAAYRDGEPRWARGTDVARVLANRQEAQLSALVTDRDFPGFVAKPDRAWVSPRQLAVSPVYEATRAGGVVTLARRQGFGTLAAGFAPKAFPGYPEGVAITAQQAANPAALLELYCSGLAALLPQAFDAAQVRLETLLAAG